MIISYLGKQCVKFSLGDVTIAVNPPAKNAPSGIALSRFGADIAFVSAPHADYNGVDLLSHGDRVPFIVRGPGEYEVKDIFIKGAAVPTTIDGQESIVTVYRFSLDNMSIGFVGPLAEKKLPPEAKELLDGVDILCVPIGGKGTLTPSDAYALAVSCEPHIVIPLDYGSDRDKGALATFLKEAGSENTAHLDKLTIKRKDIEAKEADVIVLDPQ